MTTRETPTDADDLTLIGGLSVCGVCDAIMRADLDTPLPVYVCSRDRSHAIIEVDTADGILNRAVPLRLADEKLVAALGDVPPGLIGVYWRAIDHALKRATIATLVTFVIYPRKPGDEPGSEIRAREPGLAVMGRLDPGGSS